MSVKKARTIFRTSDAWGAFGGIVELIQTRKVKDLPPTVVYF
jgi:hypothetical protein